MITKPPRSDFYTKTLRRREGNVQPEDDLNFEHVKDLSLKHTFAV